MRKLVYFLMLFSTAMLSGCALNKMVKLAEEQQLTVNPNPLEVHADTVNFDMAANLPVKMLKKDKVYTLKTFYKYGENELELDPVEFKSEDYPNASEEQPKQNKSFSFAYSPAMKKGELEIQGVASDPKNGKFKETDRLPIAKGLITTSKLVENVYFPAYADHGYNTGEELIPTKVDFYFDQGRSTLKRSETASDKGKEFQAFIAEKNITRTVTITGTHSPEGAERINSRLSEDRAKSIETYYRRQMKRYDYKGLSDSIKFILKPVIEDWTPFKETLSAYEGITSDEKSEFLNIVNGAGSFEEKEDQLQKLPSYKKVFKELYPDLRTAKTEVLTVKPKKTEAEISVLAKQIVDGTVSADTLNEEELMYAGSKTPSLTEKEGIYKAATKKSDSWTAHNNLAAVYIAKAMEGGADMGSYAEQALTQLEIAANKKEAPEVWANMGSVYLMQGNPYKAYDALSKANSAGPSSDLSKGINGVKGATEIVKADYSSAVSSLSSTEENAVNLFNKGLAQILSKDYQNAITSFNEASEKDGSYAMAYYGAAVASARLGDAAQVIEYISKAVSNDPELKGVALEDLEFEAFASNEAFRGALK